jgi:SPP1 family predicted phage head-tail adaptor
MNPTSSKLEAGALRQRVTIVAPTATQDSTGGFSLSDYTTVLETWAEIRTLTGNEALGAGTEVSTVLKLVTIRYPTSVTITAAMQVVFQGRKFQILAVLNPDERPKKLVLRCVELNDSRQQG